MNKKIYPGKPWLDTNGTRIEAHGGTMFIENGTYYWIGEDKSHTRKKGRLWTWGVKCYSSKDLCNWKDEGHIVKPEPEDKKSLFHPNRRLDRPHLIRNPKSGNYVLWLKYCDKSHYTVLTAEKLLGPYTVIRPFLQPYGHKAGDFDLAVDEETGLGYLYFEADHDSVLVCKLNDDFTDVDGTPATVYSDMKPPLAREGIAHFIHGGKHYLITSGMTGYVPNPSEIAVAEDWMGPFRVLGDPAIGDDSSATFNSQSSCVFTIPGTDNVIMMADRWVPEYVMTAERYNIMMRAIAAHSDKSIKVSLKDMWMLMTSPMMGSADTSKANYVWLPFRFEGENAFLEWKDEWDPAALMK